eukprot:1158049-Pelagomonas_calceolata.AAC.12
MPPLPIHNELVLVVPGESKSNVRSSFRHGCWGQLATHVYEPSSAAPSGSMSDARPMSLHTAQLQHCHASTHAPWWQVDHHSKHPRVSLKARGHRNGLHPSREGATQVNLMAFKALQHVGIATNLQRESKECPDACKEANNP